MKKLSVRNLALFLGGCLIIGVFINFVLVKNIFALQESMYIIVTVLSIVMCGLIIYLLTFMIIRQDKRKSGGHDFGTFELNSGGGENLIGKIGEHRINLNQLNNHIADKAVSYELTEIEKSLYKIQTQLKDETINVSRIAQLEEFLEYYIPLIVKILNSYKRIEANELTGKNATETKKQITAVLPVIKKAFEKELDYMLTDEMLDITTDIKVLEAMLSKDGLMDNNDSI